MASQGPNSAGTIANDASVGASAWVNFTNASSSDDTYTTVTWGGLVPRITNYLKTTNFGFSIPSGSTIDGIIVDVERKSSSNTASLFTVDSTLKLVIGGAVVGTNKATTTRWSTTESYVSYGGASDLWGNSISYSDINASDFGFVLSASLNKTGGKSSVVASVDHIRITVYYTNGGGGGSVSKLALLGVG